jgi:hypothetical protein
MTRSFHIVADITSAGIPAAAVMIRDFANQPVNQPGLGGMYV